MPPSHTYPGIVISTDIQIIEMYGIPPLTTAPHHITAISKRSIVIAFMSVMMLEATQDSYKIHTRRNCKSPGPSKQNRIIYRKTLTLELCEF